MNVKIEKGQVWKNKKSDFCIEISGTKGGKWLAKVMTKKPGIYNGSHRMSQYTIWSKFELL